MTEVKVILAVDLGTSGPKVGLVTTEGEVLAAEFEPTPLLLFPGGGAEQNPDDWWNAIKTASLRLLARRLVPADAVKAVCLTTQWSGTVAVDRQGMPLMNAIIWMDSRGAPDIKKLARGLFNIQGYSLGKLIRWIRLTGGVPSQVGKDSIAHILYMKNQIPDIYRQVYKFLEPKDYLNFKLTGRFLTTGDSICLHWVTDNRDINHIRYDDSLLKITGIERDKLPDIVQTTEIIGTLLPEVASELGLGGDVQVVAGTPDIPSAAIGSGAVDDFAAHLYLGTSSWLACHVPYKKIDLLHNMASLPSGIPGRYLLINEQECAGACLTYLRDSLLYPQDELGSPYPQDVLWAFNRLAEQVPPGSDKLIFTPWLYGERTPVDDSLVRGGFFNQTLRTTRSHMVRAVFEGVAFNSRWLLMYVEKFIGRRADPIHIVGGGAVSDLWCQIHADVLDRTVLQVRDPIYVNLRGAAWLASVALGCFSFSDIPQHVQVARTYSPRPENRSIYDELFAEFVHIYKSIRPIYARMNSHKE